MTRALHTVTKSKKRLTLFAVFVITLFASLGAVAFFANHGSGAANANASTLNPPTSVNAASTVGTGTVSLTWTASATGSGAVTPQGYYVTRIKNSDSSTAAACGTSPTNLTTNTSCSDTSVADGTYHYTVTSKFNSWTATSASSNNVTVVNDNAAPATTISFPVSGFYNATQYNAGCLPTGICGTASDASGVQVVRVSIQKGAGGPYWDGTAFNSVSEVFNNATLLSPNATSTNWDYALVLPPDGSYTVHVQARDTVGNDSAPAYTSTGSFSIDTTAPTTTDNSATIGNGWKNTNQTVTLTPTDGSGSGIANTYYTKDGSMPTTSSSTGTSVALNGDGLYTVKYFSVDNVGNTESVKTAGTQIRIDEANPIAGAVVTAGAFVSGGTTYIASGQALTDTTTGDPTVNGASSGVASVAYYFCSGSCTPQPGQAGTTLIGSVSAAPYSVAFSQPTDGTYSILAQATDNAGNKSNTATKMVAVDNTKPSTTDNSASIGNAYKNTTQTVTLTPADPVTGGVASGVANTYYTSDGTTPTTSSSAGTSVVLSTDGLYTVKYFSVDNVGNTESVKTAGTQIRIDKTTPNAGAVVTAGAFVNTSTYIKNGQALTDTTASDPTVNSASSGLASITYSYCASGCTGTTPGSNPGIWTSIGSSNTASSYSVTWNSQPTDGTYALIAAATDNAGNTSYSAIKTVVIDNSAPVTTATPSPTANGNGWNNANVSITVSATDNGGSGVASTSYSESGAQTVGTTSYSGPIPINTEGTTTITYHSVDNLANSETNKTVTIKLDKTKPTITIASITAGGTTTCEFVSGSSAWYSTTGTGNSCGSATGNFTVAATAADGGSGLQDVLFPTFASWTGGGDVLAPGPYSTIYGWTNTTGTSPSGNATATDNASNTQTAGFSFTLDNTAPTGAITSPSAGNVSAVQTLASSNAADNTGGSGVKSLAYYRCAGNAATCSGNPPSGTGPWTLIGSATSSPYNVSWDTTTIPNGTYTLKAVMTDNVGNQSTTAAVVVTVNNRYTFVISNLSSPQRAGTAFSGVTIQLQINGANTGSFGGSTYAGTHTITFGGAATGASPNNTAASGLSQSLTFNASGQAIAGSITLVKAQASAVGNFTATDAGNSITGSTAVAVDSAGVTLSFNPSGTIMFAKGGSQNFTVTIPNDIFGNAFTSAAGITITVTLSSTAHFSFQSAGGGSASKALTVTSGPTAGNTFTVFENGNNGGTAVTLSGSVAAPFAAPTSDTLNEIG